MKHIISLLITTPVMMLNQTAYTFINTSIIIILIIAIILYKHLNKKGYIILIILFTLEILYNTSLFIVESPILLFITKSFTFIFSIHLNAEIYTNSKSAKLLTPYILWEFYLALISIIILYLNS